MFLPSAAAAAANGQVPGAGAPDEPAWTGFAMEQIMKTLSFVNSSLVQAPPEEKEKLAHKLDDTLYCAKVPCLYLALCVCQFVFRALHTLSYGRSF